MAVLIGVFLFVFGGVGLFLYAYDKKWLPNIFWKIFAVIELASQVLLSLKHMELLEAVIVLLILSPLFITLFRLGYGKKAL